MVRNVPLDPAGNPGPDQADQRRLDHMLPVEEGVVVGLVEAFKNAAADLRKNADGSKTIWIGELEIRQRMRWAVGYTLRPGKSCVEASVRILNRTPVVNTMLCFANVAVHVNENYQVIFPPGTQYGTHHHKREFTTWPVATGRYGGADFSKGVDVSWYKNHDSANSIFAWNYEDDFLAGYDHGKQAGTMSVSNHHVVPGKKLWTWGNGPRGRIDRKSVV